MSYGSFLSHPLTRRASWSLIGPWSAPTSSCGDAPFVSAVRSLATDDAASRRTTSITTGFRSVAVTAVVAGRRSPFCPRFPYLTPTTACWLGLRPCGGALRSTAPAKRRLRSKILIACPIPLEACPERSFWPGEAGSEKPSAISPCRTPVFRPFSTSAEAWPKKIHSGHGVAQSVSVRSKATHNPHTGVTEITIYQGFEGGVLI